MSGLKVGNHTQSSSSAYEDIDLSIPQNEPSTPAEPVTTEPVTPAEPVDPSAISTPAEPVTTEPVTPAEPITTSEPASNNEPSSLTPNTPAPETTPEFDESKAFEFLSEKLGKDIKSIEDLKQTPTENPLESDPYLKELHDWRKKTGRPIEDWIKYQKDYKKLNDLDVAREFLQHEYPTFTKSEIDEELKEFQADEMDDDSEASRKLRKLKKYATKGRGVLGELVSDLGEIATTNLPPEVQQDLNLAKQYKQSIEANKTAVQEYNNNILKTTQSTDTLKLKLSDELEVDYKVPDDTKKGLPDLIREVPHWKNQDGSWNHQAVVNDAIIIKHHKDMIKLAYEQGVNVGGENIIKQTNNTTLAQPAPMQGSQTSSKGIEIEGFDEFVGGSNMKLRFNK